MAKKKVEKFTIEEKLQNALIPEKDQPYKIPQNWCWVKIMTSVGSIGRSCIFKGGLNICFQRSVSIITTPISSEYLKYFFDSSYFQNKVQFEARGSCQVGFYLNQLAISLILLPPLEEQKEIVKILDSILSKEKQVKEIAEKEIERVEDLKKNLLTRAFGGVLGTNDPNEENSIELLKTVL